jgi:hypothetical protein
MSEQKIYTMPAVMFCVLFLFFTDNNLRAASLYDFLPDTVVPELAAGGVIANTVYEGGKLALTPNHLPLIRHIQRQFAAVNPNVIIESLRLYVKPGTAKLDNWDEMEYAALYNSILAVKSLSGIQYFSRTRNKMHTLYEISEIIDSPDSKKPLPDPFYSAPQSQLDLYVRQKDTTFGDNIYQCTYYADAKSFIIVQQNLNTVTLGPLPVIGKNNFRSCAAILDAGHYLIVYMVSFVRASFFSGMNQQLSSSVNNRVEALSSWFTRRADLAYRKEN